MCGFTGFYQKKQGPDRQGLQAIGHAMAQALQHRGPDHAGCWQDPDVALVMAHRRLSIIDLSPLGNQPMASASGRYVIVYNGEIYNYPALKKELEQTGTIFRSRSDTEIFLSAVQQWGLNRALQKINGMFAIVLWDRQTQELHFIRDRLGKKPLYVGWAGDTLLFASELKAFHAHPDFRPETDPQSLALYMRFGYMPAPHSIFKNVWSLRPGHRMTIKPAQLPAGEDLRDFMDSYWHHGRILEDAQRAPVNDDENNVINDFEALLTGCVQDRLISDVPVGAFLSGGIDSSTIVALMQKISPAPVKTYTVGFQEDEFNEASHAAKIAAHLGTDHHEIFVSSDEALSVLPRLPEIYDEPFADISAIPTYLISQFARRDVTVALSGDGGDEMLGGYNRHIAGPKLWNATRFMPGFFRRFAAGMLDMMSADHLGISAPHMQKVVAALPAKTQEDMYLAFLTQWNTGLIPHDEMRAQIPDSLSFSEKMMYWDTLSYLPDDVLVKVDRASMDNSLECRAPLLDKKIYEYVWRLPLSYKIRNGQSKWLLRQVLQRHVPEEFFARPKQGFSVPVDAWLRGTLKPWADALLQDMDESVLNKDIILKKWRAHLADEGNHGQALWTILMFLAWQRRWMK